MEGDSAAGPAKRGRDSKFMAILPLRGKIVNAAKASPKQVMDNAEAQAIFTAMGAGVGRDFDADAARYGRIVILCDADVDGSHIRCLLLTLIHKYMTEMLEQGRVFTAQPPLYTHQDRRPHAPRLLRRGARPDHRGALPRQPEARERQVAALQGPRGDEHRRTPALRAGSGPHARCAASPWPTFSRPKAAAKMFDVLMGNDVAQRRDYLVENSSVVDEATLDI